MLCPALQAKVKLVADAVWSKLSAGSFSKDILHAQVLSPCWLRCTALRCGARTIPIYTCMAASLGAAARVLFCCHAAAGRFQG